MYLIIFVTDKNRTWFEGLPGIYAREDLQGVIVLHAVS